MKERRAQGKKRVKTLNGVVRKELLECVTRNRRNW